MVIFQSFENFCGFLFFLMIALWLIGIVVAMIIYRSDEPEEEQPETVPEDVQAFIDGIENAIDNGWDFPDEDFEKYQRLIERQNNGAI